MKFIIKYYNLIPILKKTAIEEKIPILPPSEPNKEDLEKELISLIERDLDEYDLSCWEIEEFMSSTFLTHPNNKYQLQIFKSARTRIIFSVSTCTSSLQDIYSSDPCKIENIKNQIWGNIYFRIKKRLDEINKERELNKLNNFVSNLKR